MRAPVILASEKSPMLDRRCPGPNNTSMTTSHPLLCPYCNSYVPAPVGGPPQRLLCPRCGEAFPYRLSEDDGGAALGPPPAPLAGAPASPRWSKWSVAGVVLGVMAFMAAAALTFVLLT